MADFRAGRARGRIGEELAAQYLESIGFEILDRNYRGYHGEVDIIGKEGKDLVFVEVKTRRSLKFGKPEESILPRKQSALIRAATGFIQDNIRELLPTRFDVVTVTESEDEFAIRHIPHAFSRI